MPNYQDMYFRLFRATEQAIHILIEAQRESEEIYISSPEPQLTELPRPEKERE